MVLTAKYSGNVAAKCVYECEDIDTERARRGKINCHCAIH